MNLEFIGAVESRMAKMQEKLNWQRQRNCTQYNYIYDN